MAGGRGIVVVSDGDGDMVGDNYDDDADILRMSLGRGTKATFYLINFQLIIILLSLLSLLLID